MNHKSQLRSPDLTHHISRRSFGTGIAGLASFATVAGMLPSVAHAANEAQMVALPVAIAVEVSSTLNAQNLNGDRWSCSVSGAIASKFPLGSQVRIRRNGDHYALYTVAEVRPQDAADVVRMGSSARSRLGTTKTFSAMALQPATTKLMTDAQAKNVGEFVERIADHPNNQGLVVLAPHGGAIEAKTDLQARWVADTLPGGDVTCWCCSGWKSGGGTHERWHVSSTDISPASFPGLAKIADRGFAYAVSFHGQSASGVLIGGGGPMELKHMLRDAIKDVIGNSSVTIADKGDNNNGMSDANIVNWLTAGGAGGIQIEQSMHVRSNYWSDVAQAVADVYADLI
jgi:phage replication-related protein YjqB (UPF0714/DUF867 family)